MENVAYSSSSEYSTDESDYEMFVPSIEVIDSTEYYRSFYPELLNLSHGVNNNNIDADTKTVAFKKKNFSQMGRRKANRAQNGTHILYMFIYQVYSIQCIVSTGYNILGQWLLTKETKDNMLTIK